MKQVFTILLFVFAVSAFSQKKILDHKDFDIWNTIKDESIAPNGSYIIYSLEKGEKDSKLKIKKPDASLIFEYDRASKGQFSYDSKNVFFTIKPWADSIKELKRLKVKKNKIPKDTLGIYNLNNQTFTKIGNVKSYKIPSKWSGFVAYLLDEVEPSKKVKKGEEKKPENESKKIKPPKKVNEDNGYHLVLRNLITTRQDTFKFVTNYSFAKEGKHLTFSSTGKDSTEKEGVYVFNLENNTLTSIFTSEKAKYKQLTFNDNGKKLAFIVDADTTKVQIRPNELYVWHEGNEKAKKILDATTSPKGFIVSSDGKIEFSKDNSKLYFGLAKPPIVKDTTLLDEEIVNVEVWTFDEPRLYTEQELQVADDKKKSFRTAIHLNNNKLVQLGTENYPNVEIGNEGNGAYALANNSLPYELVSQWEGSGARDYAIVTIENGRTKNILTNVKGRIRLSPEGKFAFGFNSAESSWFLYEIASGKLVNLIKNSVFYDELNDVPDYPNSYGLAGWTKNDESIILYDRYDIWEFNPKNGNGTRLTKGRESKTVFRFVELDSEERFLDKKKNWLLSTFNEMDKSAGFFEFIPNINIGKQLVEGKFKYSNPIKSKLSDAIIFSKETFEEFPNILYTDLSFKNQIKISDANPQQNDYNWGTIELVTWTSLDGIDLTGLLVKPENFDPTKKYPMIVNFYERSSDDLYSHKAPAAGRSTINYSFYASRGYLIFNPDIIYREGYPGESAYNCVIPGITSLIEKGFVDKNNIGVQGHSWGGYQIAYLVTKTNIFKAAESGAPVVNMISAYGGIRWGTGLSRQFQYEHTQSRIAGTPWDFPTRYVENSPIFNIDKINTPLLIMHNDADGHVPWYQGIEFFTALRRLGKPSWFLNYNDEPHWPLKFQNRKDFNIRMAQFFDHFLKAAPKPIWMQSGVPAIEKGINQGLELISE
ncbi:S9 family peptidase [Lutibacter sp.]|uniref:alpha/beta hydrolase family protein n=1 Tax=Lutibacter sp. TaxID=1925666 RepID=UPI0027376596|nr:prolyl oligopeptidase family serine peptidase [Lutibacter sp.]MDP3313389.1 prolyl oligopeptidase family serine peptidase [Lutibacter sp.]